MAQPIDNGGITDKYVWQQTAYDVTITFPTNQKNNKKDIKVVLTPNKFTLHVGDTILYEGMFTESIKCESSCWYLENESIIIEADKFKKHSWWKSAFVGDEEIDTAKVTPASESYADLDSSTKSTISKMLYDQEIKERNNQK